MRRCDVVRIGTWVGQCFHVVTCTLAFFQQVCGEPHTPEILQSGNMIFTASLWSQTEIDVVLAEYVKSRRAWAAKMLMSILHAFEDDDAAHTRTLMKQVPDSADFGHTSSAPEITIYQKNHAIPLSHLSSVVFKPQECLLRLSVRRRNWCPIVVRSYERIFADGFPPFGSQQYSFRFEAHSWRHCTL